MTPEVNTQTANQHLTEDQFGELLSASSQIALVNASPAEAHVSHCDQCAAELESLRECLSLFREASTAYANQELRGVPQVKLPARRRLLFPLHAPAYWVAAAALLLAALLPMQTMHRHAVQKRAAVIAANVPSAAASSESDEDLMDDIDREDSASVPAPMQALADPASNAGSNSSGVEISIQTSN